MISSNLMIEGLDVSELMVFRKVIPLAYYQNKFSCKNNHFQQLHTDICHDSDISDLNIRNFLA